MIKVRDSNEEVHVYCDVDLPPYSYFILAERKGDPVITVYTCNYHVF